MGVSHRLFNHPNRVMTPPKRITTLPIFQELIPAACIAVSSKSVESLDMKRTTDIRLA